MDKIETRAVSFYLKYFEQKTKAIRKDIQNTYECEKTDQFTEYNQKHLQANLSKGYHTLDNMVQDLNKMKISNWTVKVLNRVNWKAIVEGLLRILNVAEEEEKEEDE